MSRFYIIGSISLAIVAVLTFLPGNLIVRTSLPGSVEHFIGYACVAAVFSFAQASRRSALILAIGFAGIATLFETAQYFVPGRHFNIGGILSSTAGAWFGIGLVFLVRRWKTIVRQA